MWYLQKDRAKILFPSCKKIPRNQQKKFESLSDNTNPQEGLGGYCKNFRTGNTTLYDVITTIAYWIELQDKQERLGKEGIWHRYFVKATKKQKNNNREKKSSYKAPDSAHRMLGISTKKKQAPTIDDASDYAILPSPPTQLYNRNSCCYLNSLLQCLLSCPPMKDALLNHPLKLTVANTLIKPFIKLQEMAQRIETAKSSPNSNVPLEPTELLVIIKLYEA